MKYKIEVFGKGLDCFIFKLDDEQYEKLLDSDVEEDGIGVSEICEILGVEDYLDSDHALCGIINGSYHGEHLTIVIKNENDEVVWESQDTFDFEEVDDNYIYNDGHFLSISDYQKGLFFVGDLDLDGDFDSDLISAKITEALDGKVELITGLKYDGKDIILDFGDTSSKGFYFYMI